MAKTKLPAYSSINRAKHMASAQLSGTALPLKSDPTIDNIEILEFLGAGGHGQVWKAKQERLNRIVAVKVFTTSQQIDALALKRFQREARLCHQLDHPGIVKTWSLGLTADGQPFLLQEFVPGEDLAKYLGKKKRLNLLEFRSVFSQILQALEYAHSLGIIHRDLKPSNIMIYQDESGATKAKILDFGSAKLNSQYLNPREGVTNTGMFMGSALYMSPEQCRGAEANEQSDIYALACTMYETITGSTPFIGDSVMELAQKHWKEPPPSVALLQRLANVNTKLANLIIDCLAKEPGLRPASAKECHERLLCAINDGASSQQFEWTGRRLPLQNWTTKMLGLAIISAAMLCASFGSILTTHSSQNNENVSSFRAEQMNKEQLNYNKLLEDTERKHGKNSLNLVPILHSLAASYCKNDKHSEERECYHRVLLIRKTQLPPTDPHIIDSLKNEADSCGHMQHFAEAEALFKEAFELQNKIGAEDIRLFYLYRDLANVYAWEKEDRLALPLFQNGLALGLKLIPNSDEKIKECYKDLYMCLSRLSEKEALNKLSAEINQKYGSVASIMTDEHPTDDSAQVNKILHDAKIFELPESD